MVGVIIATHGNLAKGVLESSEMIFGKQEKVEALTLERSEGPEDLRAKLDEAIASFGADQEILFLVDLAGGTPSNQVNILVEENKDKRAVVTGVNLPMLIETYASRMSMESAHDIALSVAKTGREGIQIQPKELEQTVEKPADAQQGVAEGTVIGDGEIEYVLARIDSRLLHGQVATAWTKTVKPNRIIVVSDSVSQDDLRKKLIEQAAPPGVKANVIPISKLIEISKDPRFGNTKALLLFENPQDVLRVVEGGVDLKKVNLGSMSHSVGKSVVNNVLSMDKEDVEVFEKLLDKGIEIDVRKVPNDSGSKISDILEKANKEVK